jgi:hypothetical protein
VGQMGEWVYCFPHFNGIVGEELMGLRHVLSALCTNCGKELKKEY